MKSKVYQKITKNKKDYHTINGKRLHSPSAVLSHLSNFNKIPERILENSRMRGSAVMKSIYDYTWCGDYNLSPIYQPIMNQYFKFLNEYDITIFDSEKFIVNPKLEMCGFVDLIGKNENGKRILIEVKTRDLIKYPLPYDTNYYQTAFYALMTPDISDQYILTLDSKGRGYSLSKVKKIHLKTAKKIYKYYREVILKGGDRPFD